MTSRITAAEYRKMGALTREGKRRVTPETALKRTCAQYLRIQGWLYWAFPQQGMMPKGHRGRPDGLAVKAGRHVWIEFKAPGKNKKLRPDQELRKAELEAAGATVLVVDCLEDLYVLGDERQGVLILAEGGES